MDGKSVKGMSNKSLPFPRPMDHEQRANGQFIMHIYFPGFETQAVSCLLLVRPGPKRCKHVRKRHSLAKDDEEKGGTGGRLIFIENLAVKWNDVAVRTYQLFLTKEIG